MSDEIQQFIADEKTKNTHLHSFKKNLQAYIPIKQQEKLHYKSFAEFLQNYEETRDNKSNSVGELAHVKLIEGDENALLSKLEKLAQEH